MFALSGCSGFTSKSNITNLLSAPKLSENESSIVAAIEDYLGDDVNLKYSQNQGYSAPIQLIDINHDRVQEALVFYYAPNKGTNIRFAMLSHSDDSWSVVMDKEGLGNEVFYFDTAALPNLKNRQIMVGYQSANIDGNFFVTYFTDTEKNIEDYAESCQHIIAGDMTGNGYDDIIITKASHSGSISVNVLAFTDQLTFVNMGQRSLKYANIDVEQLIIKKLKSGRSALFADYTDSYSRMHTEVYAIENGRIVSCLADGIVSRNWEHQPCITSRDIDGDGYIEIATVVQPQHPDEVPSFKYLEWRDWTDKEQTRVYYGVFDIRDGIFMALPDQWQDKVYAVALENGMEIVKAEDQQTLISLTEIDSVSQIESSAYSYPLYMGTKLWHLECSEDMNMTQIEYVYKSITDLN